MLISEQSEKRKPKRKGNFPVGFLFIWVPVHPKGGQGHLPDAHRFPLMGKRLSVPRFLTDDVQRHLILRTVFESVRKSIINKPEGKALH